MPTSQLVRNSERSQWLRCRQSHHWAYTERLKPKIEAPALRFGTLIHKALEARYPIGIKRGPLPHITFSKVYNEQLKTMMEFGFTDSEGEWEDAHELGVIMMKGYVEEYGKDQDYEVLATERIFKTKVVLADKSVVYLVGTMDGVWKNKNNSRLLIQDYKTTKDDPTKNGHLTLDEQATMYMSFGVADLVAAGFLKGYPSHMMYTFMKKQRPDERKQNDQGLYLNQDGSVSKNQGTKLFHRETVYRDKAQRLKFRARAKTQLLEMQTAPVYKNPGKFTCGGCGYRDMCEMEETGADIDLMKKIAYTDWDPYDAHELKDEANAR